VTNKIPFLLLFVFLIVLPLTWFKEAGSFLLIHDQYLPLNIQEILNSFYMWTQDGLGNSFGYLRLWSLFPDGLIYLFLYKLGFSVGIAERIVFVLLFSLPGIFMYGLLKEIIPSKEETRRAFDIELSSVIGALLYSFNMYLVLTWHGSNAFFAYALLPLFIKLFRDILFLQSSHSIAKGVFLGLLSILAVSSNVRMIGYILFPVLIFFIFSLFNPERLKIKEFIKPLVVCVVVAIGVNLVWLIPAFYEITTSPAIFESGNTNRSMDFVGLTAQHGGWLQQIRLIGQWTWGRELFGDRLFFSFSDSYDDNWILIFSTILIPVFAAIALLKRKNNFFILYAAILIIIFSFLAKGIQPPLGNIFEWLFKNVPLFNMFRTPDTKFTPNIVFGLSILIGFSIYIILRHLKAFKIKVWIFLLLAGLILINSWPLLTGFAVIEKSKGYFYNRLVKVPEFYKEAAEWINNDKEQFKIALFPGSLFTSFRWEKGQGHSGQDLLSKLLNQPVTRLPNETPSFRDSGIMLSELYQNQSFHLFPLMNIKYVLLRDEMPTSGFSNNIKEQIQKKLLPFADKIKTFNLLHLYKVKDKYFVPRVYAASKTTPVIGNMNSFLAYQNFNYEEDKSSNPATISIDSNWLKQVFSEPSWFTICSYANFILIEKFFGMLNDGLTSDSIDINHYQQFFKQLNNVGWIYFNDSNSSDQKILVSLNHSDSYRLTAQFAPKFKKSEVLSPKAFFSIVQKKRDLFQDKRNLKKIKIEGINCDYDSDVDEGVLKIGAYFDGEEDEFVKVHYTNPGAELLEHMGEKVFGESYIDLEKYPYLALTYDVQEPLVQTVQVVFRIRTKKGRNDHYLVSSYLKPASKEIDTSIFNLLKTAKKSFPNAKHYYLTHLEILPHKIWGVDCSKKNKGKYLFNFYDIKMIDRMPILIMKEQIQKKVPYVSYWQNKRLVQVKELRDIPKKVKSGNVVKKKINLDPSEIDKFSFSINNYASDRIKIVLGFNELDKGENLEIYKKEYPAFPLGKMSRYIEIDLKSIMKDMKLDSKNYQLNWMELMYPWQESSIWRYNLHTLYFEKYHKSFNKVDWKTKNIPLFRVNKDLEYLNPNKIVKINENNFKVQYDSLKMEEAKQVLEFIPNEDFIWDWVMILPETKEKTSLLPSIDFDQVNSTRYIVDINGGREPFWLVLSESFHHGWKAYIRNNKQQLPIHVKMNGFANGWWLDPATLGIQSNGGKEKYENIQVVLEFIPQRNVQGGLIFSVFTFLSSLIYLGFHFIGRRRNI